jgi:Glycosyl hydrolase family 26
MSVIRPFPLLPIQSRADGVGVTRRRVALLAVLAFLLAVPAAQARPVVFGAYTSGAPESRAPVDALTAKTGRAPGILMWYRNWTQAPFDPADLSVATSGGAVPMGTWEPRDRPLAAIRKGTYDDYIRTSARAAVRYGRPVFVRFAHEMNGDWYPWGRSRDYVAAWRHVVSLFRAEGASNVRWVWAPNVDDGELPFEAYYPGDGWVDWVGLDGYAWGHVKGGPWLSFAAIFGASYDRLGKLTAKPMMITETAANDDGYDKAGWIRAGLGRELAKLSRVRALIWFDKAFEGADWRVDSSPAALAALRTALSAFTSDPSGLLAPTAAGSRRR